MSSTDHQPAIQRLAPDHTVWHAWMEDHDWWNGNELYADLDLGKAHAARDYEADEYPEPDGDPGAARPDFVWHEEHDGNDYCPTCSGSGEPRRTTVVHLRPKDRP